MTVMALSSVPLGRTPRLPESPQSPFLLQVQGSVRAQSFVSGTHKHFRAFFHIVIITLDKKGLPLSHFMGKEMKIQTEVKKQKQNKHPIFLTSKCPNG